MVRRTGEGAGDVLLYWEAGDCGAEAGADGLSDYLEWAAGRAPGGHPFQVPPASLSPPRLSLAVFVLV